MKKDRKSCLVETWALAYGMWFWYWWPQEFTLIVCIWRQNKYLLILFVLYHLTLFRIEE